MKPVSAKSTAKPTAAKPAAKTAAKPAAKSGKPAKTNGKPPAAQPAAAAAAGDSAQGGHSTAFERIKASALLNRPNHTPAIFKPGSRRPIPIVFTLQDVRDLLKRQSKEDKEQAASAAPAPGKATASTRTAPSPAAAVAISTEPKKSKHDAASLLDILGFNPADKEKAAHPEVGHVPAKWKHYHDLLIELRDQVRAELNIHSADTLKRSQREDAGDISTSADAGTDNFDRDFALSLLSAEQEMLKEIEAAIQRIYKGSYGICEVTGKPIKAERLEAVPFTRFSLEGQRQHEASQRRRVQRAGAFIGDGSESIGFGEDDGES
jgi:DnaK suppressor protein